MKLLADGVFYVVQSVAEDCSDHFLAMIFVQMLNIADGRARLTMPKLIDFQCPNCGAVKEGFDDDRIECDKCVIECDKIDAMYNGVPIKAAYVSFRMQPILSPKNNSQRWRHRDKC